MGFWCHWTECSKVNQQKKCFPEHLLCLRHHLPDSLSVVSIPDAHVAYRGALEYLTSVSSSKMVTLSQLPMVTAWIHWVPSVCLLLSISQGVWQNKECHRSCLSCFLSRRSMWVIPLCLVEKEEALSIQSFKCGVRAGPRLLVMQESWKNSCFQFGACCILKAAVVFVYICIYIFLWTQFNSVHFSPSVRSDSLRTHGLQQARLPCPSPTSSCPLSQWYHPTIWSSVDPFSSRLQSFPASVQFSSVQSLSHVWLCDPMNCSTPGLPLHHQLPEFTQIHVHRISDAIQPSHPLLSPSPPAPNPSIPLKERI